MSRPGRDAVRAGGGGRRADRTAPRCALAVPAAGDREGRLRHRPGGRRDLRAAARWRHVPAAGGLRVRPLPRRPRRGGRPPPEPPRGPRRARGRRLRGLLRRRGRDRELPARLGAVQALASQARQVAARQAVLEALPGGALGQRRRQEAAALPAADDGAADGQVRAGRVRRGRVRRRRRPRERSQGHRLERLIPQTSSPTTAAWHGSPTATGSRSGSRTTSARSRTWNATSTSRSTRSASPTTSAGC